MSFEIDPRFKFAAERTMLAWIRTGLALMGFGFVVAEFGPETKRGMGEWSLVIGISLTLLGIIIIFNADRIYKKNIKKLIAETSIVDQTWNMGRVLSWSLSLIGLMLIVLFYLSRKN